jgi:hypothetical protein
MDDNDVYCLIFTRNDRGLIGQVHTDSEHVARVEALHRTARQALDVLYNDSDTGALCSNERPRYIARGRRPKAGRSLRAVLHAGIAVHAADMLLG